MNNELQNLIEDVGDMIHDTIANAFDEAVSDAECPSCLEYAPYGDTQVISQRFIGDDDEIEVREKFEGDFGFDELMERLKADKSFRSSVIDLINHIAWNRSF